MLRAPHLLWQTHSPPGHVGKHAIILLDTSANISSGAQLCHLQWYWYCMARSLLGYITPHPALQEVGRAMLIGSGPPDQGGKLPSSSATCQICRTETRVLQCMYILQCICTVWVCMYVCWEDNTWVQYNTWDGSGTPEFIVNLQRALTLALSQPFNIGRGLCNIRSREKTEVVSFFICPTLL